MKALTGCQKRHLAQNFRFTKTWHGTGMGFVDLCADSHCKPHSSSDTTDSNALAASHRSLVMCVAGPYRLWSGPTASPIPIQAAATHHLAQNSISHHWHTLFVLAAVVGDGSRCTALQSPCFEPIPSDFAGTWNMVTFCWTGNAANRLVRHQSYVLWSVQSTLCPLL